MMMLSQRASKLVLLAGCFLVLASGRLRKFTSVSGTELAVKEKSWVQQSMNDLLSYAYCVHTRQPILLQSP